MSACDFSALDRVGLNLQAVFNLDSLPATMQRQLLQCVEDGRAFRQLILIGNAGPRLWSALKAAGMGGSDPIDEFSVRSVSGWFRAHFGDAAHLFIYPGSSAIGLQTLGTLAGWHHASPFKVGIHQDWGTWFAYRVALLADTALPETLSNPTTSPCESCRNEPCIPACPAQAMTGGEFALDQCIDYRRQPGSRCATSCIARLSCPVASDRRYPPEQVTHVYSKSLEMIEHFRTSGENTMKK